MLDTIKDILRPLRRLVLSAWNRIRHIGVTPSGTLVYVGLHRGDGFDRLFRRYARCIALEANPELYRVLRRRFGGYPNVELHNLAAAAGDGEVELNLASNDGKSSSLGRFDPGWANFRTGQVRMVETVRVPAVNLYDFLSEQGVDRVDLYVSDIQGMDLTVLKTLEPMLERRAIGAIQCEVAKDETRNPYADLPANDLESFEALLRPDYRLAATGWSVLEAGRFKGTPEDWWEMDCLWVAVEREGDEDA